MTLAVNKTQEQSMQPANVGGRLMGTFKQRFDETITYLIDYSNWLADSETVSSTSFYISPSTTPAAVITGSTVQDGNQILFQFDNGKDGQKYVITIEATTSTGQIKVDYFIVTVGTPSKEAALSTVDSSVIAAQAARIGAETAQTGAIAARNDAVAARTGAQTAQAGAEAALAGIGNSITQAQAAKIGAETARDAAITAKTTAETARTGAEAAQANVITARDAAIAAQAAAETAKTGAETARTGAQTAKAGAETAQAAAAASATDAATSASTVGANASIASNKATEAATSATNAAASATTATTKASEASTSATSAASSASTATTKASEAATSASSAATSATNSSSSATAAAAARTAAESARDATLAAYDSFDDRYLGPKASDPTLDNDGNALIAGSLYFNTSIGGMKVYTGADWVAAYISGASGALFSANNLSDLVSPSQARNNLGLADSATKNIGTVSGTVAAGNDSRITGAAQKSNNLSDLDSPSTARNNLGLGTAATQDSTSFAYASHTHTIANVTGLQTALDNKAASTHTHISSDITDSTTVGRSLLTAVDAAAQRTSLGLGTAATQSSGAFAPASHGHAIADVTGLQAALDGKAATLHAHSIADVTGLQTALDSKAAASHTHIAADITDSTEAGRAILTAADAAAQRASLGLGSAAMQSTSAIANTVLAAIPDPVAMALVFGS